MEGTAQRRLALLSSHVRPPAEDSLPTTSISPHHCASSVAHCVFCKIIRGESPAVKLYEDDKCICILDKFPLCDGHSLIIPKSHFRSLDVTPPTVIGSMCSKVPLIGDAVMKATGCDSFNLLVNNGAAAGQVVYHTHMHIIPRKAHDCLWTSESIQRRTLKIDEEVSPLADRIRQNLVQFVNSSCEDSKAGVI